MLHFLTGNSGVSGVLNGIFHEKEAVERSVNLNRHLSDLLNNSNLPDWKALKTRWLSLLSTKLWRK